jgi:hypothetical protein
MKKNLILGRGEFIPSTTTNARFRKNDVQAVCRGRIVKCSISGFVKMTLESVRITSRIPVLKDVSPSRVATLVCETESSLLMISSNALF